MRITRLLAAALMFATPALALASTQQVPEPESLALLGIGAVALIVARWRNKK